MIYTITTSAGKMLRALLFITLLFMRPFIEAFMLFIAGISFIVLVGILIMAREQLIPIFALLTLGLVAVAINFCFQWALMLLAPKGFVMNLEK